VFFMPNVLGHSDNYIRANPLVTPTHIVPEWYFLPFYAILRSVPDKLTGVLLLVLAIVECLILPFYYKPMSRSSVFDDVFSYMYWIYIHVFCWLLYLGAQPIETPFYELSQLFTLMFFVGFIVLGFRERIFLAETEKDIWRRSY
jgi:ubiquinol-cytochrome c reductase cytochrome b subunit